MESKPILVTGGSGYIATFCIANLLDKGYSVRTTLRSSKREAEVRENLALLSPGFAGHLSFAIADLMNDSGWTEALSGCSHVLHVASPFPATSPKDDEELVKPARDGALRVLSASRAAGVKRVVMTSSCGAIVYGRGGRKEPFTEADWTDVNNVKDSSAYERSKTIAEKAAWDWIERDGGSLELVVINPSAVLGPVVGTDFSTSTAIVKMLLETKLAAVPRFGWALVDVRDIAELHVLAMNAPDAAGKRYIGAGPFLWLSEIAEILREKVPELARSTPRRELPDVLVRLSANFNPSIRERLYELGSFRPCSAARAIGELGWSVRPVEETIVSTAKSLAAAR